MKKEKTRQPTKYIRQLPLCGATAHIQNRSLQLKKMKIKLIIQIILLIFFKADSICQTLPMTKEEIVLKKIETIIYKKYALDGKLIQINKESYDKTGKLILEQNKSIDENAELDFLTTIDT